MTKKKVLKHIIKEGARYHVVSYFHRDGKVRHCSEPDCEINYPNKSVGETII